MKKGTVGFELQGFVVRVCRVIVASCFSEKKLQDDEEGIKLPCDMAKHRPKCWIGSFAVESLPDDEFLVPNVDRIVDCIIEQVPVMF